uniref:ESCRT-II complex subunit, putative n=1 Tax=Theileria annulata TaxID=5874 RepID=A0A3B0MSJ5_THEAN
MDSVDFNTHVKFKNFPPLYTEQINNLTLSKQLEIWHKIINDEVITNYSLHKIGTETINFPPFKNEEIVRNVNVSFLALILEYLAEKQYAFYLHPIQLFCKKHNVTIWGALFLKKNHKGTTLFQIHDEYTKSLNAKDNKAETDEIDSLKKKRNLLVKSTFRFGVFPYPLSEMTNSVLECIKSQCTNRDIETIYHIFYSKKECNKDFNKFPEENLAFILSKLSVNNQITLSFNDSVPLDSLNNKNVGVQLL